MANISLFNKFNKFISIFMSHIYLMLQNVLHYRGKKKNRETKQSGEGGRGGNIGTAIYNTKVNTWWWE